MTIKFPRTYKDLQNADYVWDIEKGGSDGVFIYLKESYLKDANGVVTTCETIAWGKNLQEALDNFRNPGLTKTQLAQLGLGFFSGMPFLTIANAQRMRKQNEAKALKQAQEAVAKADFDRVMSQGNNQQDFYDSLNEGRGSTAVSGNPNTSGAADAPGYSGPSPFAQGGLVDLVDIYD